MWEMLHVLELNNTSNFILGFCIGSIVVGLWKCYEVVNELNFV